MKVVTVDEMREMDRRAVEELGVPDQILMENAGLAVYFVILSRLGVQDRRFAVFCGSGNNGGDGLVVARKLASQGAAVEVVTMGDPEGYSGSAGANWRAVEAAGLSVRVKPDEKELRSVLHRSEIVVDALLGTGLTREVGGPYRSAVGAINDSGRTVVAVDIPSGVDGDTGKIWGAAVRAHHTVTFGLPKRGSLLYPGFDHMGQLWVSHISYPAQLSRGEGVRVEVSQPPQLPPRRQDGHKGTFGDVLFVAGAAGYFGAPTYSALSLMKAGGGYARLAPPRSVTPALGAIASELVFMPQPETESGSLSLEALDGLLQVAAGEDFVVVGPGLSLEDETQELVRRLVGEVEAPLLVDGDGLTAVSKDLDVVRQRRGPTVLTPHPGEMARLTGLDIPDVLADPIGVLQRTCADLGAVIVLKGAHSLVGRPDGRVQVNLTGNSGMASAGSGDVLTGTIAAMVGQGLEVADAVAAGVLVHGLAGDLAAAALGEDGMTARDLLEHLPAAVARYRADYREVVEEYGGVVRLV